MLTQEQETLMTNILEANKEVAHDRTQVTSIGLLPDDPNLEAFDISNVPSGDFNQVVISNVLGNKSTFFIYTPMLICGHAPDDITMANTTLDNRETNEITNKMTELKNTIP